MQSIQWYKFLRHRFYEQWSILIFFFGNIFKLIWHQTIAPRCGRERFAYVQDELAKLDANIATREADITGLRTMYSNVEGKLTDVESKISDNSLEIAAKFLEAQADITQLGNDEAASRAALQASLESSITDLKTADLTMNTIVTNNGAALDDVQE